MRLFIKFVRVCNPRRSLMVIFAYGGLVLVLMAMLVATMTLHMVVGTVVICVLQLACLVTLGASALVARRFTMGGEYLVVSWKSNITEDEIAVFVRLLESGCTDEKAVCALMDELNHR